MRLKTSIFIKHTFLSLFFMLGILSPLSAQIIILDQDQNPIKEVMVYSTRNNLDFVMSDEEGYIEFHSNWTKTDSIIFMHSLYKNIQKPFAKFKKHKVAVITLKEDINLLEEIVVSVNVNEDNIKNRAERSILINKREIERISPQNTADLLSHKAGISVQRSQQGGGSPNIRGFEANRVLLVLDGIRMNNAIYRGGHLQSVISIDPAILNNSEILFGPSSVIYGSDAMGGVVHFRTRVPQFNEGVKYNYSSNYASANKGFVNHIDVSFGDKRWAFLSSLTRSEFGDLRMGAVRAHGYDDWGLVHHYWDDGVMKENPDKNIQKRTGYSQTDILQKAVFKINNHSKLIGNFQYSNSSNINRFDRLNDYRQGVLKFSDWYYGPQKRLLSGLTYEDRKERKFSDFVEIIAAYQNLHESRHQKKTYQDNQINRKEEIDVYSLNANFRKKNLAYGIEVVDNVVQSNATNYYPDFDSTAVYFGTRYPTDKAKMQTYAAYTKYSHRFNEKWNANLGLRYTHTNMAVRYRFSEADFKMDTTDYAIKSDDINWNASIVYHPNESWKIAGIFSTGFHVPNIDDVAKFYEKGSNTIVPNFDLKTEYSKNLELSISKNIQNKHILSLNTYYSLLENPIVKANDYIVPADLVLTGVAGSIQSNINEKKGYIAGFTASIASKITSKLQASADITYTQGEITDRHEHYPDSLSGSEVIAHIPPFFGKIMLTYSNKRWTNSFSIFFNGEKKAEDFDLAGVDNLSETPVEIVDGIEVFQGTPAWYTLNFKSSYQLNSNLNIQAGLENILDHHYKMAGSGLSAPGRNFTVTVRANF